jgi:hypothetical protein
MTRVLSIEAPSIPKRLVLTVPPACPYQKALVGSENVDLARFSGHSEKHEKCDKGVSYGKGESA